jgi:phenylpyruvate tautomerase PptA (4-oxalocrotonate tautomerase family)
MQPEWKKAEQGDFHMPISTIHVPEGRYDERRLHKVSAAVQDAAITVLKVTSDHVFLIVHELPRKRFLHTPSYLGMKYSDGFILLEFATVSGPAMISSPTKMFALEGRSL